ncbi:MAG: EAL domain-containing protein [Oscillospiraceae bacterium]|nr:EAL domain-containing protein [Oscillospiraceae bacterium]
MSEGLCELMGDEREKLVELYARDRLHTIHPDDAPRVRTDMQAFLRKEGSYDRIYRTRFAHGEMYHYVHARGTWQTMPDGTELVCILYLDMSHCMDETDQLSGDGKLFRKDFFFRDSLTGLPNLNYLIQFADERVKAIRTAGKQPLLIFTDVISMQFYNSQYGFEQGNKLLCQVAEALREVFPEALLARGADDHFVLIDALDSEKLVEEKVAAADDRIRGEAEGNTTGIKAGACVYQEHMNTVVAMDHARDAVKWLGNDLNRVCHFYTQTAEDHDWNQRYIIDSFDRALEEGWIRVFYQGISRTNTGKNTAYEALARWVDPVRGTLSPKDFIPALEKYHLLHRLDLFMAEQACRDMPVRKARGLPVLPVSVNFAAQDFDYEDIPGRLNEIYNRYCPDLCPERKYLIVEITEQDMAQARERFHAQLRQLKELGFSVWLDDFGSGYSSLNAFSRFEVDLIKFDMDLLRNLDDNNGANRRIMNAMVQVARELGIHTLAEGMETERQRSFLKEIGCELAQGYLNHRPEPLEAAFANNGAGEKTRPFETPEERNQLSKKWFEESEHSLAVIEQFGDHMPGGFFICRADESGELLYANKIVWQIFGCDSLTDFKAFSGFNLRGMVHPEDCGAIFSTIRKRARGYLQETDYLEYRIVRKDGETRWVDEYNYFVHSELHKDLYYVFLSDTTESRQRAEAEKVLRSSVIEALTRVYNSVWIIHDLKTQCFELFRTDVNLEWMTSALAAAKVDRFYDGLLAFSRLIVEEDRKAFLEAVTPENIEKNTREKRVYSVPFRRMLEEGFRYYRLEFTRLDLKNGENTIVAGTKDVDEEVRKEQEVQHSLKLRAAVIEALTQVYDSVWIIKDLKSQRFELFRVDKTMAHMGPALAAARIQRFTEALSFYSRLILPEDRQAFLDATAAERIRDNTRDKVIYSVPFRRVFDTGIRHYRMEFTRLDLENGETNIVAGFKDVDEEVRKEQEVQDSLKLRAAVIEALTRVYDSVWIIRDLETQRFELFRVDKTLDHMAPASAAAKIVRFTDAFAFYTRLILPEDRQAFLDATTPERIAENTTDKVIYSVPFRRMFEDGTRCYRVEFTRMNLENGEANIVVGFKDVDEETRRNQGKG